MSTFLSTEEFAEQLARSGQSNKPAPNPSEYSEVATTSRSYWIREHLTVFDSLHEANHVALPDEVDVVVIGSGISGASVAHHISELQPDLSVAVLEARGICSGATGRNGGHIGRPNAYQARALAEKFGDQEAVRLREFGMRNKDALVDFVRRVGAENEVDLRYEGTIVVFKTPEERETYQQDDAWCRARGMDVRGDILDQEQTLKVVDMTPEMAKEGSVLLRDCGTIYPRKLVEKLFSCAMAKMPRLTVHPYTPVTSVTHEPETSTLYPYGVATAKGTVRSRAVFHATNAYSSHLISELCDLSTGVYGCKAHMLAVRPNVPQQNGRDDTLRQGFGYDDFCHWILQRPKYGPFLHGDASVEALGDYDDTVTISDEHPAKAAMLRFLETTFPQKFSDLKIDTDVVYDWTGIQGFTSDGASIVGRPRPNSPAEFCSVGHNGEGMGRCFLAAGVATQAMLAQLEGKSWKMPEWFPQSYARNLEID